MSRPVAGRLDTKMHGTEERMEERKAEILRAIVEEYVSSATPVASKTIVESRDLGVSAAFDEGDIAEISFDAFTVRNARTGDVLQARSFPDQLLATMRAGGVFPVLEAEGLVAPAR